MIVSGDKDFIQLQKYDNVKQYSPITKKLVDGVGPKVYIKEHVLKGDKSDENTKCIVTRPHFYR